MDRPIEKIRLEIAHGCDGPITPFVLIERAMRLADKRELGYAVIANALYEELVSRGWLVDDEDAIEETGS